MNTENRSDMIHLTLAGLLISRTLPILGIELPEAFPSRLEVGEIRLGVNRDVHAEDGIALILSSDLL